jgi:hypothetical protein
MCALSEKYQAIVVLPQIRQPHLHGSSRSVGHRDGLSREWRMTIGPTSYTRMPNPHDLRLTHNLYGTRKLLSLHHILSSHVSIQRTACKASQTSQPHRLPLPIPAQTRLADTIASSNATTASKSPRSPKVAPTMHYWYWYWYWYWYSDPTN